MHFMWTHFLQFSHSMAWQLSVTSCSHTPHGYSIITDSHEAESVLIESDVDKTDSSWVSVLCCLVITGPGLVWRSPERSKIMLSHEFRCLWSEEAKLKLISNFSWRQQGKKITNWIFVHWGWVESWWGLMLSLKLENICAICRHGTRLICHVFDCIVFRGWW